MRIAYALAAAVISTAAIAQAPTSAPGSKSTAAITAGTYTADPAHTLVVWTLDHMGFSPYTGLIGDVTGTLELDPKKLGSARVDMTIPLSKVVTASAELTQHLLRPGKDGAKPDFYGASPAAARFVSTSVAVTGQSARITGNLTLNNVTRPVTLEASFYGAGKTPAQMGGKEAVGFKASGSIRRSQFGLGFGVPMVGDEVKLDISAAFQK